jgi:hypothetical protein
MLTNKYFLKPMPCGPTPKNLLARGSFRANLLIVLSLVLPVSCPNGQPYFYEQEDSFYITSPKSGWQYYNDRSLLLSMNTRSNDIVWKSDRDGFLGNGNNIVMVLTTGTHEVSANYRGKEYYVTIAVDEYSYNYLDEKRRLVNKNEIDIALNPGSWFPAFVSLDGTLDLFSLVETAGKKSNAMDSMIGDGRKEVIKDININMPDLATPNKVISHNMARGVAAATKTGDKKTFFVANTRDTLADPHKLEAEILYIGDRFIIWKTGEDTIDPALLNATGAIIQDLIMPRVTQIWGDWADIDGDNRISILFCHTINEERIAVGFFNDSDFYAKNNDKMSEAYNPYSNEMDMIYIALPDKSDSTYSPETIYATIAHEMTHAINYTHKTYRRYINGTKELSQEDVFIDEGWSHLSENLCGFSVSGGNIYFLKKYLEDTKAYSFCKANIYGQYDSPGMRGAMTLFLSWLFWNQGGMEWSHADQRNLIDKGGITFLRKMARLDETGWESIGTAFERPVDSLFMEFVYELNKQNIIDEPPVPISDPYTGQPVEFFVTMKIRNNEDGSVMLIKPTLEQKGKATSLLPWSFCFIEPVILEQAGYVKTIVEKFTGSSFVSFIKGHG